MVERAGCKEDIQDEMIHSAIVCGTLVIMPQLRSVHRIVAASVKLGTSLNGWFDRGFSRRAFFSESDPLIPCDYRYLARYGKSFSDLTRTVQGSRQSEEIKERILKNSCVFANNVAGLEVVVLKIPFFKWTLKKTVQYREALNLFWSEYMASLSPKSEITIKEVSSTEDFEGVLYSHSFLLDQQNMSYEARQIRQLFYLTMAYQTTADLIGVEGTRKLAIPGIGSSLDCFSPEVLEQARSLPDVYFNQAAKNGAPSMVITGSRNVLRPFLNLVHLIGN